MNRALLIILLAFWRIIMILPRKVHIFLAKLIGYLFLISSNKRNKYSKINIDICFPELSQNQRDHISKKNIKI